MDIGEYKISREVEAKRLRAEIPVVPRPKFPVIEVNIKTGEKTIPDLRMPDDLTELDITQVGKLYTLFTAWAMHTQYLAAVSYVDEAAAKDIYEAIKRNAFTQVERVNIKDVMEGHAETAVPNLRKMRKVYQKERAWRLFLVGHVGHKDNPGGVVGVFKRGADTISRYITLMSLEHEIEKRYGDDGTRNKESEKGS